MLGLGVTDILRVELQPGQLPWVVEQIGALRYVYEDTVIHDRKRWEAIPRFVREAGLPHAVEAEKDLDASEFDLRALDIIRGQLADAESDETTAVTIYGPSRIVGELVRNTARQVATTLNELLENAPGHDADARATLARTAVAARAWTELYVECQAVEWFRFDLDSPPTGT